MELKTFFEKTKYILAPFAVLVSLSLLYDGFEDPVVLALRLLVCIGAALFFSRFLNDSKSIYLPVFAFLSVISCNLIFLTDDIHILLSLIFFLLTLACNGKFRFLAPVFSGLCVIVQPLTLLFFVPSIVGTLFLRKEKVIASVSAVASAGAFILTKALEQAEFYSEQFSSYHLSVHLVHFSNTHIQVLTDFIVASIPLVAVLLFFLIRFIMTKHFLAAISLVVSVLLSVWGFAMSENTQTVFLILVPLMCSLLTLYNSKNYEEIFIKFNVFFSKNLLLFLLAVAFTASYPILFGQIPFDSDFFSKATFIIFRQE